MGVAERLSRRGVNVDWRDYTYMQLIEMERGIK
jgi:hypothetical protein